MNPARRRGLAWLLVGYGIAGLLLFGLGLGVVVRPLVSIADRAGQVDHWLEVSDTTLGDVELGSTNARSTLSSAADAARNAGAVSDGLAASMAAAADASGVSILGTRPLAGLAGGFGNVANQARALSASMSQLAGSLGQNTADFGRIAADVATVRTQMDTLRSTLSTGGLGADGAWLGPVAVGAAIWLTLPAVASLFVGLRLLRRQGPMR